ncbi:hypothetical protein SK128_019044 [Halocaridina rubra]|uniref:Obg domain-containing protein n=1 Tax=Halocaridina rubra TaxID=373956 RepID=A0AAN8ZT25_HALRR
MSDCSLDSVNHRNVETHSNAWKDMAKQFLKSIKDHPEHLEDKYVPIKKSKSKSKGKEVRHIVDYRHVRAIGGEGGDGCISFLSIFRKEQAGPDGGDGGNGGHVVFKAKGGMRSLEHIPAVARGESGEKGSNKDCHGASAPDKIIEVPLGTVFKFKGHIVASLEEEGSMFVAARGGAGGKGNAFFTTDV